MAAVAMAMAMAMLTDQDKHDWHKKAAVTPPSVRAGDGRVPLSRSLRAGGANGGAIAHLVACLTPLGSR